MRPRPKTELYLGAVRQALERPGVWVNVRVFETQFNAAMGDSCLRGGYLRVEPRESEVPYVGPKGERWLATPSPVESQVLEQLDGWLLRIRVPL